jgi:fucose permease
MRQIGSVVFLFCAGAALFLVAFGLVNDLHGQPLRFCLGAAAAFCVTGVWLFALVQKKAKEAEDNA